MATSNATPAPWSLRLVDDAGLFPPEQLSMPYAVARHRADLAAHSPVLSHRFICPTDRLSELVAQSEPGDRFQVVLLGPLTASTPTQLTNSAASDRIRVVGLETKLDRTAAELLSQARAVAPDLEISVEVPLDEQLSSDLDLVASWGVQAKVRCGGTTADAFPSPEALAAFVVGCVRRDLPFKATAGLHHAVAYRDPVTGFAHFGFLNLLAATALARTGAGTTQVATVLSDPQLPRFDETGWTAARTWFRSFGSCSTSDPQRDLVALTEHARSV